MQVRRQGKNWSVVAAAGFLFALLPVLGAYAATPFDGQWKGIIGRGGSCPGADVKATIADGILTGQELIAQYVWPVSGAVVADGSFVGKINGLDLKGKFEGSHFVGNYYSPDCKVQRELTMDRVN